METDTTKKFIQYWLVCKKPFKIFRQGESYWLEKSLAEDIYNVRSDNALGQYVRISDQELFDNFERTDNLVFGM